MGYFYSIWVRLIIIILIFVKIIIKNEIDIIFLVVFNGIDFELDSFILKVFFDFKVNVYLVKFLEFNYFLKNCYNVVVS